MGQPFHKLPLSIQRRLRALRAEIKRTVAAKGGRVRVATSRLDEKAIWRLSRPRSNPSISQLMQFADAAEVPAWRLVRAVEEEVPPAEEADEALAAFAAVVRELPEDRRLLILKLATAHARLERELLEQKQGARK